MPITHLNLTDLDNRIRDLEQRFGATSYEMLKDEKVRARISEDVLLRWETYVRQRVYLRDLNNDTHNAYLRKIRSEKKPSKSSQRQSDLGLAA